ncbi:MAG: hypothetical protein HUJ21_01055 [Cyclobacterium sp.]|nr:hypothetical protein [Cyclobacterium sp.]
MEEINQSMGNPWTMVHCEEVSSRDEAMERERQIKNLGSRRYLQRINNPDRPDDSGSVS